MAKVIYREVNTCKECPFSIGDNIFMYCIKMRDAVMISDSSIDKNCPLPDAEDK